MIAPAPANGAVAEDARRVFFVAGEASGDLQAARLATALRRRDPRLVLSGIGGSAMRDAGVATDVDIGELSVMGIAEVVGALARVRRIYRRIVEEMDSPRRPQLLVLVDFPEFNLLVARAARRRGVPVLYYVSPQVWAWRRGRVRKIRDRVDGMVVLFPFEEAFYAAHDVPARFFGHPLAETVSASRPACETRARHGLPAEGPIVALLPGSRVKEVDRHLPLMLSAARLLEGHAHFAIARAPGIDRERLRRITGEARLDVAIVDDDTYNLLSAADAAAVASGTATVETALLGCPHVVVYKTSGLTYTVARALVRTRYIGMPNIILDAHVVPELIQGRATPEALATELRRFLDDPAYARSVRERLSGVRDALVRPGAADRAAAYALELLR
jgi:lipid-A-disaccharide synthase